MLVLSLLDVTVENLNAVIFLTKDNRPVLFIRGCNCTDLLLSVLYSRHYTIHKTGFFFFQ